MRKETWFTDDFIRQTAEHELTVIRDGTPEAPYRHLRFKKPGTMAMHFDLITWPGYLCYTGDMGTYVFTRLTDMLQFFRRSKDIYQMEMRYWAEKVEAADKSDGVQEFAPEMFVREITEQRRRLLVDHGREMSEEERQEFWGSLGDVKRAADDGEHRAFAAAFDWTFNYGRDPSYRRSSKTLQMEVCEFPSCKKFSHRFKWACHALAWGINVYYAQKEKVAA